MDCMESYHLDHLGLGQGHQNRPHRQKTHQLQRLLNYLLDLLQGQTRKVHRIHQTARRSFHPVQNHLEHQTSRRLFHRLLNLYPFITSLKKKNCCPYLFVCINIC
uniref:Uncharacterized protein n=1 Tax=uncultured marine virus TaxID=186617 RepID=A0A0F7L1Q9_9VIRU|nr:hypothetical protein [uncultured marine virus]